MVARGRLKSNASNLSQGGTGGKREEQTNVHFLKMRFKRRRRGSSKNVWSKKERQEKFVLGIALAG